MDAFLWDAARSDTAALPRDFLDRVKANCDMELAREVIPFWVANGVDEVHGGFICGLRHNGSVDDDSKFSWYQGRGAWVFAQLYERTGDDAYLGIARRALDFVRRHCVAPFGAAQSPPSHTSPGKQKKTSRPNSSGGHRAGEWAMWDVVARNGSAIAGRTKVDDVGYASLFYAEGLQAVARHEPGAAQRAGMLQDCIAILRQFHAAANDPDRDAPEDSYLLHRPYARGTRTLGHSMIPLRICTQLLRDHPVDGGDDDGSGGGGLRPKDHVYLSSLAVDCVHNILRRHLDTEFMLLREELAHDWGPLDPGGLDSATLAPAADVAAAADGGGRGAGKGTAAVAAPPPPPPLSSSPVLFYLGHAVEACWFVLDEAWRSGDAAVLELAGKYLRRHASVAWDELCGGMVRGVSAENDHNDKFLKDKVAWVQQEGLVGALMIVARCRDPETVAWARGFFRKLYRWTMKRFPLARHVTLVMENTGDDDDNDARDHRAAAAGAQGHSSSSDGGGADADSESPDTCPCPLWLVGGNRAAAFEEEYSFGTAGLRSRKENYHHPRFLLMAQQLVDEIIAGGGTRPGGPGRVRSDSDRPGLPPSATVETANAIAEAFREASLPGVPDLPDAFPSRLREEVELESGPDRTRELDSERDGDSESDGDDAERVAGGRAPADRHGEAARKPQSTLVFPKGATVELTTERFADLYDALETADPAASMRACGLCPQDRPYALDGASTHVLDLTAEGYLESPQNAVSILEAAKDLGWKSLAVLEAWKY